MYLNARCNDKNRSSLFVGLAIRECPITVLFYICNLKDVCNPKPRYKRNNFVKMLFAFYLVAVTNEPVELDMSVWYTYRLWVYILCVSIIYKLTENAEL